MKKNKLVYICLIGLVIGGVLIGIGNLCGGKVYGVSLGENGLVVNSNKNSAKSGDYIEDKKDLTAFKNLDMNIAFADVKIVESDHFEMEYCVPEKMELMEEMQGDKLV